MPAATPRQVNQYAADHELLRTAVLVVTESPLGLFTTISPDGKPRARWMLAAVSDHGLCRLFSLTGRLSHKLHDIAANPAVCWVFTSPNHTDVVTITGKATVLPSLASLHGTEVAWVPLMHATRYYAMASQADTGNEDFMAVETDVDRIELLSPRLGIYTPCVVPFDKAVPAPVTESGLKT